VNKIDNPNFVHWHCHTEYSALDGLSKVTDVVLEARKMGFPALAITDHGNIGGWIKFIQECAKTKDKDNKDIPYAPIKPILGAEFYLCRNHEYKNKEMQPDGKAGNRHLNVFATNWKGYQNLCTLSNKSWVDGLYYNPRIDIDLLEQHSEGLMIGSACLSSVVNANLLYDRYEQAKKAVATFKDIFGKNFFLEVMYHGIPEEAHIIPDIIKLSSDMDVPIVATNDCFVAGTMIKTNSGIIPIENLTTDMMVLSHKNRMKKISFINKRSVSRTFKVKSVLGSYAFESTPDHPVYVVSKLSNQKFSDPMWKNIIDLNKNDYLLLLKNSLNCFSIKDIPLIDIKDILPEKYNKYLNNNYYITKQAFGGSKGSVSVPRFLPVTDDLLFILGRFIAEGHLDKNAGQIGFAANCNENTIQDRIENYFSQFGITSYRPVKNLDCKIVFSSVIWHAILEKICGRGALNKHLPVIHNSFYDWSLSQIKKIISAYIGGDGHIAKKQQRASVVCASISKRLAFEISDVLQTIGFVILPSCRNKFSKHKNPKADTSNWNPLWILHLSHVDRDRFFNEFSIEKCGDKLLSSCSRRKYIDIGNYYAIKVKDVFEVRNPSSVFNIQVEEDETYIANNYVVHNCHYTHKSQGKTHEVLMCMNTSRCITDTNRIHFPYEEFYLKSAHEMSLMFGNIPNALTNSVGLLDRIDQKDIEDNLFGHQRMPSFKVPDGFKDAFEYLKHLVMQGAKDLGYTSSDAHMKDIEKELRDIKSARDHSDLHFDSYFLIIWDIINWARSKNILVGTGRGSGYASLVLRCLKVCYGPDPKKFGLLWERFLGFDELRFVRERDFGFTEKLSVAEKLAKSTGDSAELADDERDVEDDQGGVDRY